MNHDKIVHSFHNKPSGQDSDGFPTTGRQVATLATGAFPQSSHTFTFNASALAAGIYFLRLESDRVNLVRKAVLLR